MTDSMADYLTWPRWLSSALARRGKLPADIAREAAVTRSLVSRWLDGTRGAAPDMAVRVAQALLQDPVDALRAAGHREIADYLEEIRRHPNMPTAAELRLLRERAQVRRWAAALAESLEAARAELDDAAGTLRMIRDTLGEEDEHAGAVTSDGADADAGDYRAAGGAARAVAGAGG